MFIAVGVFLAPLGRFRKALKLINETALSRSLAVAALTAFSNHADRGTCTRLIGIGTHNTRSFLLYFRLYELPAVGTKIA